jgi:hypothetical protein
MSNRSRLTLKRNKLSALLLIVLLGLAISSALAATQTASPEEKTASLFSLFDKANATVLQSFQKLEAKNIAVPQEALTGYDQAVSLREEAEVLRQVGNWSEASSKLIGALQKLKQALWIVYETAGTEPTQTEITLERNASLESSIRRLQEQLSQLENLARSAQAAGFNTSAADVKIGIANSWIANASQNLNRGKFDQAQQDAREAKSLIDELTQHLSNIATELSTQRLEAYIATTETRLAAIKQTALSTSNTASLTAVGQAETSLNLAKTYLEEQLVNQTVTALVNSKESEETAVAALKPSATSSSGASLSNSPTAVAHP